MNADKVAQFEIISTAKEAWAKVSGCKTPILLAALAYAAAHLIIHVISHALCGKGTVGQIAASVLTLMIIVPAYAGLMYMGLQRARGLPVMFNQLFYAYRKELLINIWLYYLCISAVFLIGAMVFGMASIIPVLGLILMVAVMVGILYVLTRLSLGIYFILDKNEKVIDALKHSYAITSVCAWKLMLANLLICVALFLGVVTLIGLIWVIPLSWIYLGFIYEKISWNEAR